MDIFFKSKQLASCQLLTATCHCYQPSKGETALRKLKEELFLGMYDIGFFADIRYADISNSLWPIADADTDIHSYFFHLAERTIMHAIDCTKYDQEYIYENI